MMELEVETVGVVERTDVVQQLLALQVTDLQQLQIRLASAIADKLDGLRDEMRADEIATQHATGQ